MFVYLITLSIPQRFTDEGFVCHASYSTGYVYGKGLASFVFLVLGVDAAVVDEKIAVCAPVCARAARVSLVIRCLLQLLHACLCPCSRASSLWATPNKGSAHALVTVPHCDSPLNTTLFLVYRTHRQG